MEMDSWHSYPSIFALGHCAIANLLTVPVDVTEKVDGSQFSFGVDESGEIHLRSKGNIMVVDAPERMFAAGAATVKELAPCLHPGWTYRAEYFAKPKQNALAYDRIPRGHIIVFDINTGHEAYLPYTEMAAECERIGLECVPLLRQGMMTQVDELRSLLETQSVLGGQTIEGVVLKPSSYNLFGLDKKVLMGKFVSEKFKEVHAGEWKKQNPTNADILDLLGAEYRTPARWQKAVLHLAERGVLEGSPRDIGGLMKEVPADVEKECTDDIKERLFAWAWPHLRRKIVYGVAEWYKEELMKQQFNVRPSDTEKTSESEIESESKADNSGPDAA